MCPSVTEQEADAPHTLGVEASFFRVPRQRRYQILLLKPSVQSLCRLAPRSDLFRLVSETRDAWVGADPTFDAWRLVLTNQSKSRGRATPASNRNIKNGRTQRGRYFKTYLNPNRSSLLLLAFPSLSNVAASVPSAKSHQLIVFIGWLAGWNHFDDLPSRLETLPYMGQRTLNCCVCVARVRVQTLVACICRSACADAWHRRSPPYLESPPVCEWPHCSLLPAITR